MRTAYHPALESRETLSCCLHVTVGGEIIAQEPQRFPIHCHHIAPATAGSWWKFFGRRTCVRASVLATNDPFIGVAPICPMLLSPLAGCSPGCEIYADACNRGHWARYRRHGAPQVIRRRRRIFNQEGIFIPPVKCSDAGKPKTLACSR